MSTRELDAPRSLLDLQEARPSASPPTEVPQTRLRACAARMAPLGVVVLLGALLRLQSLDAQSLWVDEGLSVWGAEQPLSDILHWLAGASVHPPLYFLYLHIWIELAGDSTASLRLASVVPGVLTIPVLYALGQRLHTRRAGLLAALLLACSPFAVYYSQEVRMYSLFGLMATLATYCLVWGLQTGRRRAWVLYAIAAAATMYSHNVGATVVLAHAVILVTAWLAGNRAGRAGLVAFGAAALTWVPWIPLIFAQSSGKGGSLGWIGNPDGQDMPALVETFASDMLPEQLRLGSLSVGTGPVRAALIAAALALALTGLVALRRRRGAFLVGCTLLLGPLVLALDAGLKQPVFLDRTLTPVALFFLVAIAIGCVALASRFGRLAGALVVSALLGLNAAGLASYWDMSDGRDVRERWDVATQVVAAAERPGDLVALRSGSASLPFAYYHDRQSRVRPPSVSVPCPWLAACPGGSDVGANRRAVARRFLAHPRVWLLTRWWASDGFRLRDLVGARAESEMRLLGYRTAPGVHIWLYETPRGRAAAAAGRLPENAMGPAALDRTPTPVPAMLPNAGERLERALLVALLELAAVAVGAALVLLQRRRRPASEQPPGPVERTTARAVHAPPPARAMRARPSPPQPGPRPIRYRRPIVNVNTAVIEELILLPGVGRKAAARIVAHREQRGPFASVAALEAVDGFDSHRVNRFSEQARV